MDNNVPENNPQMNLPLSSDDAAEMLLARWTDAGEDQPSDSDVPEATATASNETEEAELIDEQDTEVELDDEDLEGPDEEVDLDEDDEEEEEEEEDDEEEEAEEAALLSEDSLVPVQVDGETLQVPAKKLARLYGQEASLTRKSQELATQ